MILGLIDNLIRTPVTELLEKLTTKYGDGVTKYFVIICTILMVPVGFAFSVFLSVYVAGFVVSFLGKFSKSLGNAGMIGAYIISYIVINLFFILIGVLLGIFFSKITKQVIRWSK